MNNRIIIALFVWFLIMGTAMAQTTTAYTLPTTTLTPDQATLKSCAVDFFGLFLCSFNIIPYLAYLLVFLGFGIGYVRTHKLTWGTFAAFIASAMLSALFTVFGTAPNLITVGLPLMTILLFVATAWWELHR